MSLITCILIGLILGQHIKVTVDPSLIGFLSRSWALATEKAPLVKGFAVKKMTEAQTGPLQKAASRPFQKADREVKDGKTTA